MSDAEKLKDAVKEHSEAKKRIDDNLNKAEESVQQVRQERRDELNRPT